MLYYIIQLLDEIIQVRLSNSTDIKKKKKKPVNEDIHQFKSIIFQIAPTNLDFNIYKSKTIC